MNVLRIMSRAVKLYRAKAAAMVVVAAVTLAAACCETAWADLLFSTSTTTSSYLGSPFYTSVAATSATVAQGNPSLGS